MIELETNTNTLPKNGQLWITNNNQIIYIYDVYENSALFLPVIIDQTISSTNINYAKINDMIYISLNERHIIPLYNLDSKLADIINANNINNKIYEKYKE